MREAATIRSGCKPMAIDEALARLRELQSNTDPSGRSYVHIRHYVPHHVRNTADAYTVWVIEARRSGSGIAYRAELSSRHSYSGLYSDLAISPGSASVRHVGSHVNSHDHGIIVADFEAFLTFLLLIDHAPELSHATLQRISEMLA